MDIEWESFRNSTVLVTGASGLLGRQIVMTLLYANSVKELNLRVIGMVHNLEKAEKVFECLTGSSALVLYEHDINNEITLEEKIDFIIHGASVTSSKYFVEHPVETIYTSINGMRHILEVAKSNRIKAGVYLSSMEIYGVTDKDTIKESDYGYIDHINVRSSYSESKKMCECLIASYSQEYGVPFKIARLTQTFGPGVEKGDKRVFAQFAENIIQKKDIVLFSEGKTVRNYCYTTDAVRAILLLLLKGESGQAYNIANEKTEISIIDMARMLIDEYSDGTFDVKIQLEDASKHGFNPVARTCIDTGKMVSLGWEPEVDLKEAYNRMIQSMMQ